jgi:hypothetical protein
LNRYIGDKKILAPPVTELGTARVRVWTEAQIENVRQLLPEIANGRKTRYKKKQSALSNQRSTKTKAPARVPVPHKERKSRKK